MSDERDDGFSGDVIAAAILILAAVLGVVLLLTVSAWLNAAIQHAPAHDAPARTDAHARAREA